MPTLPRHATRFFALLFFALGAACDSKEDTGEFIDLDGDGVSELQGDCDDENASVHPDAEEIPYDSLDNDCDEGTPDDDLDGDGFTTAMNDCDDDDPQINPNAVEVCDDEDVDEDCNGLADDEDPGVSEEGMEAYYPDDDGDGYGADDITGSLLCQASDELPTTDDSDCDDDDEDISPAADEICDALDTD